MVKPTIKSNSESQDLLKVLSHCKSKIRNAILKNCENDLIHIICDCVYNVVKGNVPGLTQEITKNDLILNSTPENRL